MGRLLATTGSTAALTCACVAITLANSCRADAINSWQGASASVDAGGKQATDAGATASASTGGSYSLSSWWAGAPSQPVSFSIESGGSASASGNPDNLLTATTSLNMPGEGRLGPIVGTVHPLQATASWNGDSLIVHAPPGASLPDSVQLQFKVDLSPALAGYGIYFGSGSGAPYLSIGINGKTTNLTPVNQLGSGLGGVVGDLGGVKLQPPDSPSYHQTGTFNIALALHPNGVSDPFSLSVSSSFGSSLYNGYEYGWRSGSSISLSLTGVTLPDGTPLTAAGYGGAFASGMALPEQSVPEPATFVVWGLLAVAAVTGRHRTWITRSGR